MVAPPRHHQIFELLRERIRSGQFAPGQPLPAVRLLCKEYNASQPTVEQALRELLRQGLVRRDARGRPLVAGAHDRTAAEAVELPLAALERNFGPLEVKTLSCGPADETDHSLRGVLELGAVEVLLAHRRLISARGSALALDDWFYPGALATEIRRQPPDGLDPWPELFQRFTLRPILADRVLSAVPAPEAVAALLSLAPGEPMLSVEERFVLDGARAVAGLFVRTLFPGSRAHCHFQSSL